MNLVRESIRGRSLVWLVVSVFLCFSICVLLSGCSNSNSDEPDYADDEVMAAVADGLEKRWDIADQHEANDTSQTSESFSEATQAELNAISDFRDRQFEDSKLQEAIISYINKLEEMNQLTEDYPFDSDEFYEGWTRTYDERLVMLKNFVDTYDLEVDSAHANQLSDLMTEANVAVKHSETEDAINSLVSSLVFEQVDEGYGYYSYTATAENTSDYSFTDVSLVLALYDADGVMVQEAYAGVNSWPSGETVKFETGGEVETSQIKVSLEYYDVAE